MRKYILTERDRQIMRTSINEGVELDGFRDLKWRLKTLDLSIIETDLELIRQFREKYAS